MIKFFALSVISFLFIISSVFYSSAEIYLVESFKIKVSPGIEVAEKGRLFIGMTKIQAYEVEGVPYRTKRLKDEEGKEIWIYRCNNEDGFDEDCLYLYFSGDELRKIERP